MNMQWEKYSKEELFQRLWDTNIELQRLAKRYAELERQYDNLVNVKEDNDSTKT